jgi:hypothetical protein
MSQPDAIVTRVNCATAQFTLRTGNAGSKGEPRLVIRATDNAEDLNRASGPPVTLKFNYVRLGRVEGCATRAVGSELAPVAVAYSRFREARCRPGLDKRVLDPLQTPSRVRGQRDTRTTLQPAFCRTRVVLRSRFLFPQIFSRHAFAFALGVKLRPQSCPCQKHPSTKTAKRRSGHAKSGLPASLNCRRHPKIRCRRSNAASRSSVVLFPMDRTRAMSCPRRKPPKLVCSRSALPGHVFILFYVELFFGGSPRHLGSFERQA